MSFNRKTSASWKLIIYAFPHSCGGVRGMLGDKNRQSCADPSRWLISSQKGLKRPPISSSRRLFRAFQSTWISDLCRGMNEFFWPMPTSNKPPKQQNNCPRPQLVPILKLDQIPNTVSQKSLSFCSSLRHLPALVSLDNFTLNFRPNLELKTFHFTVPSGIEVFIKFTCAVWLRLEDFGLWDVSKSWPNFLTYQSYWAINQASIVRSRWHFAWQHLPNQGFCGLVVK